MHRIRLALVSAVVLAGMVAIGAGSAASNKSAAPKAGGTVTFAAEQEPPCLNLMLTNCANTWTNWSVELAFRAIYIEKPNFTFAPDLGSGQVISKKPMILQVKLQPKAVWSDGVPITVDDLIFMWKTIVNPKWDIASRSLWDSIKTIQKVNPKTAKIIFKKPVGPWKYMLGEYGLIPAHALAGADFNNVWNDNNKNPKTGKPIGSGPWLLSNYTQGQSITLVPNPKGWPHPPKLSKLVFVFRTNTDSEIQAIRGGEVDAIYPQPQLQLADLRSQPGIAYQTNVGTNFEHLDLNIDPKGSKSNPLLNQLWFRQMIAYGMDRQGAVSTLYRSLNPKLKAANNITYPPGSPDYKPDFAQYTYQPKMVAKIAQAHGCKKGGDGIWTCSGQRASFTWSTTAGNKLRELMQEIIQAQERAAGIEIKISNVPSGTLFGKLLPTHSYDMALYAWVTSGDPAGQTDIYGCGGGENYTGLCDKIVTNGFKASDAETDPVQRAADVNRADAQQAKVLSSIPLYMKPTFFFYKKTLHGLVDNPTSQGPTWNSENWTVG
jgi:peptide/nickel transport system substrate-binding protein